MDSHSKDRFLILLKQTERKLILRQAFFQNKIDWQCSQKNVPIAFPNNTTHGFLHYGYRSHRNQVS